MIMGERTSRVILANVSDCGTALVGVTRFDHSWPTLIAARASPRMIIAKLRMNTGYRRAAGLEKRRRMRNNGIKRPPKNAPRRLNVRAGSMTAR
jgi:hypothetical protein